LRHAARRFFLGFGDGRGGNGNLEATFNALRFPGENLDVHFIEN
jgi:hypothetical protein